MKACEKCKCKSIKKKAACACHDGSKPRTAPASKRKLVTKCLDIPDDLYATIEHIAQCHGLTVEETVIAFFEKAVGMDRDAKKPRRPSAKSPARPERKKAPSKARSARKAS